MPSPVETPLKLRKVPLFSFGLTKDLYLTNCSVAILAQAVFGPNAAHRRFRA